LEFPVLLALLGALAWLVPWFGALLAVVPALLAGLSGGVGLGILAAVYTIAVLIVQEWVIEPRIFRRQSYSSLVLVLVILILADMFGLVGLILAPLVSAALQIIFKYLVQPPIAAARVGGVEAPQRIELLEVRLGEMRSIIETCPQPVRPEITSLVLRLERLVTDTSRYNKGN
jgi:predicted PurR-regulated permease PerM